MGGCSHPIASFPVIIADPDGCYGSDTDVRIVSSSVGTVDFLVPEFGCQALVTVRMRKATARSFAQSLLGEAAT